VHQCRRGGERHAVVFLAGGTRAREHLLLTGAIPTSKCLADFLH
jgi:hypothetical protein